MQESHLKNVSELTFYDFVAYPVWTWAEDDEDESLVMPLNYTKILPEDYDALFVSCNFLFSDGTEIAGVIAVRLSNHSVYLLSFPQSSGSFFDFPLDSPLKNSITRQQLAQNLKKSLDEVFPIVYSTPYIFGDGQPLIGQIE